MFIIKRDQNTNWIYKGYPHFLVTGQLHNGTTGHMTWTQLTMILQIWDYGRVGTWIK